MGNLTCVLFIGAVRPLRFKNELISYLQSSKMLSFSINKSRKDGILIHGLMKFNQDLGSVCINFSINMRKKLRRLNRGVFFIRKNQFIKLEDSVFYQH